MIIQNSQLDLSAQSSSLRRVEETVSMRVWSRASVSPPVSPPVGTASSPSLVSAGEDEAETVYSLSALALEKFFGIKIRVFHPGEGVFAGVEQANSQASRDSGNLGWGMELNTRTRVVTEDALTFQASGTVTTADGRTLGFALDISLSRRQEMEETLSLRFGDQPPAVDPLVLQLRPGNLEMSDQSFAFDLDGDGTEEMLPVLASGSFFLALDRNGDERITEGSELFGPSSGHGFSELSALDGDGNRWIDEADGAFLALRLWQPDGGGRGSLLSLTDAGVGALSIDAVSSAWDMDRASLAQSGVFLRETGEAGHLGELLLKVTPLEA
jgi:hypothetical protein